MRLHKQPGEIRVRPDYVFLPFEKTESFVEHLRDAIGHFYGPTEEERSRNPDYCRIVSDNHFNRLAKLLEGSVKMGARIEIGGNMNAKERFIAPTVLSNVSPQSPIMDDEIFGPLLPILQYRNIEEAYEYIRNHDKPLALYVFSSNKANTEAVKPLLGFKNVKNLCH